LRRFLVTVFMLGALAAIAVGGAGLWWVYQPLRTPAQAVDLSIEPGTTAARRGPGRRRCGRGRQPGPAVLLVPPVGQDRQIKAGSYELEPGITPHRLLRKLARGEEALQAVVLVEGWTFRQVRAALAEGRTAQARHQGAG
jgi:UPF0755 protein